MSSQTRTGARPASPANLGVVQTYSTTDVTVPAAVSPLILTATDIAAKTPSLTLSDSAATNPSEANFDQLSSNLGTVINTCITDLNDIKQVLNLIIDALQANGVLA
jgi:hypothetical protein